MNFSNYTKMFLLTGLMTLFSCNETNVVTIPDPDPDPDPVIPETYRLDGVDYKMVKVEGGPNGDFYIMQTELHPNSDLIINGVGLGKLNTNGDLAITQDEFDAMLTRIKSATGVDFCIPTAAEWIYAAKGGKYFSGYKYAGSNDVDNVAWYIGNSNNTNSTHEVAKKDPNELGLYDMCGNYSEVACDNGTSLDGGCYYGGNQSSKASECTIESKYGSDRSSNVIDKNTNVTQYKAIRANYETVRLIYRINNNTPEKKTLSYGPLTYNVDGQTYNMIKVEGCTSGEFYMMQTELPPSSYLIINGIDCGKLNSNEDNAVSYSELLNMLDVIKANTGLDFDLPTKDEWQYAAKGGASSKGYKYCGSDDIGTVAWYSGNSNKQVHSMAQKTPNELGFYDMSGNYAELVYEDGKRGGVDGNQCGGSWKSSASDCAWYNWVEGSTSSKYIDSANKIMEYNNADARYVTVRLIMRKQ